VLPSGYAALALAMLLLTLAQLLQKVAVTGITQGISTRELVIAVLRRPAMGAAVACLGSGLITWLLVLDSMDVSKAFPYLSLGQVFVLLVARYYFHEQHSRFLVTRRNHCGQALSGVILTAICCSERWFLKVAMKQQPGVTMEREACHGPCGLAPEPAGRCPYLAADVPSGRH